MIGGYDVIIQTNSPEPTVEGAVRLIREFWKDAIVENAETGETLNRDPIEFRQLPAELLIYRDIKAKRSWAANGATAENANLMIHLICGEESVTAVVDDPKEGEISEFLSELKHYVLQDIFLLKAEAA